MLQSLALGAALGFTSITALSAPAPTNSTQTYVLDVAATADATCPDLHQQLWSALVEGQTEGNLHLRWEIDCGESHDGKTDYAVQIVVEADASAETALTTYLASRSGLSFWGTSFVFRQASQLEQTLTIDAGVIQDDPVWNFEVLASNVYQSAYPSDTAYLEFYSTLADAFWFAGVDGFTDFIGQLFGTEFAATYRSQILPQATAVQTKTKLRWKMADGSYVASRMIYDILHDCRVRDNGHCA